MPWKILVKILVLKRSEWLWKAAELRKPAKPVRKGFMDLMAEMEQSFTFRTQILQEANGPLHQP